MVESVDEPKLPQSARFPWLRGLLLTSAALFVPGLPFLFFGESAESAIARITQSSWPPGVTFAMVVGVLSTDLLLPIPSSAVSTFAGNRLGIACGIGAVWLGMTLGAILGFALARFAGPTLAARLATPRDVERLRRFSDRFGRTLLVLTRPLPLFAEAAVVLAGALRQPWKDFLLPVCLSNLAIATAYACLGYVAQSPAALLTALVASVAIPLALTFVVGRYLDTTTDKTTHASDP